MAVVQVVMAVQHHNMPDFLVDQEVDLLNIVELQQADREILHLIRHHKEILVDQSVDQVVRQD
jgi:hypothetical protein